MYVRMLGSLEVFASNGAVSLGGANQRMALGYLLLHANSVVPVERLMPALWGSRTPASGRKALQNAVSRLRRLLGESETPIEVSTRTSGYLLRIDPEQLDLHQFRKLAAHGRATLADGDPRAAGAILREALALWRGPALADVADQCGHWRELKVLADDRLDVLEQYFEAELSTGRHQLLLSELEVAVSDAPTRERFLSQLMLAYHRCGRSAQALAAYRHSEVRMAELFGIDPSRQLRRLAEAIKKDDPALRVLDKEPATSVMTRVRAETTEKRPPREIKPVTTLVIGLDCPRTDTPESLHRLTHDADQVIRAVLDRFGGALCRRMGSLWTVAFGVDRTLGDEALRAVHAGFGIRSALADLRPPSDEISVRMVIADGSALVDPSIEPPLTELVLGEALALLPFVHAQEIWLNARAHDRTAGSISCRSTPTSWPAWSAMSTRRQRAAAPSRPFLGRSPELARLAAELDACHATRSPRLVTIVGAKGAGKTRLVEEFVDQAEDLVVLWAPVTSDSTAMPALAATVHACAGLLPGDSPQRANSKLCDTVRRVARSATEAEWLISMLRPMLGMAAPSAARCLPEIAQAWSRLVLNVAAERPAVLIVDDIDSSDAAVWAVAEGLLSAGEPASLLIVACTKPMSCGDFDRLGSIISLPPLQVDQLGELVERAYAQTSARPAPAGLAAQVADICAGNPMFAIEYAKALGSRTVPAQRGSTEHQVEPVPDAVVLATTAAIDRLPPAVKTTLRCAALVGRVVWPEAVAIVAGDDQDCPLPRLDELAEKGLLGKTRQGEIRYEFLDPAVLRAARATVPATERATATARLVAWLDAQSDERVAALQAHPRDEIAGLPPVGRPWQTDDLGELARHSSQLRRRRPGGRPDQSLAHRPATPGRRREVADPGEEAAVSSQ